MCGRSQSASWILSAGYANHSILDAHVGSKNLGFEEPAYSAPKFPPGFEDCIGIVRPLDTVSRQCGSLEKVRSVNGLRERIEDDQNTGDSHGSFPKSIE